MMKAMRIFLLALGLAACGQAQTVFRPTPVAARDFPVMAWGGSPSDPEVLKGMKETGLNISGFCRVGDLERVAAAGLTCFVTDRRANGYSWDKLPPEDQIRKNVAELAQQVGGNPTVLGFYLRDEPHASLMPGMGRVAALLREVMPDKWPYVNLFPYRGSPERLGTPNYDSYVRLLVDVIHQPFLSYDNYSLVKGEMLDYFYTNLEVVRRLSVETGVPLWNCVLSNAHFNYMENTDATYHLQAYATMAHGGRGMQYFSYFTWANGNYRLGPIDQFGNKTRSWDMIRYVNNQIHALAPTLKKLRSTGVYHYPDVPPECRPLSESKLVRSVEMTQRMVTPPVQARFLVGEFTDDAGRPYIMLVNKDLNNSFRYNIEFKKPGKLRHISQYSGEEGGFGREMDWIAPGAGHLFRVE